MGTTPTDDALAIVTGGSCGPGRDIARTLASWGYAVVVVYLRARGEAEAAGSGPSVMPGTRGRRGPAAIVRTAGGRR